MKHLLGYVIWNKVNMIEWIVDGIIHSFKPTAIDILFVLDDPKDGSDKKIRAEIKTRLKGFKCKVVVLKQDTGKFTCQNLMMKYCLENKYKSLIAPQDDQKVTDKKLISNINKVFDKYGETLGVIGLRDGFDFGYQNMISSEWSESPNSTVPRLKNGEAKECTLLNDGGLIYPLHLISKIGFNDVENYKTFYIEDDYCMKAKRSRFINVVMGNSLIHDGVRASMPTTHYNSNSISSADIETFKSKWICKT